MTFERGQTFRFLLGYQLGQITRNRKEIPCELCSEIIEPGALKGCIRYARRTLGDTWYGQTSLCLSCVKRWRAPDMPKQVRDYKAGG